MLESNQDFAQQTRDGFLRDDLQQLVRLAIREDLSRFFDLTTMAVVPPSLSATAHVVARQPGIASGIELIPWILQDIDCSIEADTHLFDGDSFQESSQLATLRGEAQDILTCERTLLNFLGRLCGIATWTERHVRVIQGLDTHLYDTRKTTPGWRRLEKYAVSCGGARNHRSGLYDAILIKDNHLACHASAGGKQLSPSEAVVLARRFLQAQSNAPKNVMVEIEVDTLEQFEDALQANPEIVLLDNMSVEQLLAAVSKRNEINPKVQIEASGGIDMSTLRKVAETGVDRISIGALTHSAVNLDLGLDWEQF